MVNIKLELVTKIIATVTAVITMFTGGYTLYDKLKPKPILTWHEEYFSISNAPVTGTFDVIIAREKHRDDCSVEQFKLSIKDSKLQMHPVDSSISTFSGPASNKIDKFGYQFIIPKNHQAKVNKGPALLVAHIVYKCPEGQVIVTYPDSKNLTFKIL